VLHTQHEGKEHHEPLREVRREVVQKHLAETGRGRGMWRGGASADDCCSVEPPHLAEVVPDAGGPRARRARWSRSCRRRARSWRPPWTRPCPSMPCPRRPREAGHAECGREGARVVIEGPLAARTMATPMLAALSEGASLTPSPVMDTIWPCRLQGLHDADLVLRGGARVDVAGQDDGTELLVAHGVDLRARVHFAVTGCEPQSSSDGCGGIGTTGTGTGRRAFQCTDQCNHGKAGTHRRQSWGGRP